MGLDVAAVLVRRMLVLGVSGVLVLVAGGLIIGKARMILSRILGAPQPGCSFLSPRIVRST